VKTYSSNPVSEETALVPCPVCGRSTNKRVLDCDGFAYVRCTACAQVFQNPQPTQRDLILRYGDGYFEYERTNEENFFQLMKLALDDVNFSAHTIRLKKEAKSIVDIGCATGMLIHSFQSAGWIAKGVEVCEPSAQHGIRERGVDIHIGTLESASFEDKSFGVVHSSHVIEHLSDPVAFVREGARILRDDGVFVVTTPNVAGFQAKLLGSKWRSAIADHVVLFTPTTLRRLLTDHGFTVITEKTWGGIAVGLAPKTIKRVADRMAKRFGFGDVMVMLARKNVAARVDV
jgi:2-polyprenyl-3-methyl-5-hydroxy-6-metoxy-1,4-benzoquinol methylase